LISDRQKSGIEVEGNMGGKAYVAGIDDENIAHILGLFTDLYSDTIMAVIREYSTNALDAMVEAGVNAPVEVTLPSMMSPFLRIRDAGVGLDEGDIATIYSRYGSSTKRATNDQNGMLGLGCKSALTYTDTFTVTSVKEGVKTICVVSREGTGVPVMTVPSVAMTDEPNGTEVSVPVKQGDRSAFADRATKLFEYWPEGSVLVNGKPVPRFKGLKITDDLYVIGEGDPYGEGQQSRVVMGGVAYPVEPSRLKTGLARGYAVVAFVPIGAVNFSPDREKLAYDGVQGKATVDTLARLGDEIRKSIAGAVQREVSACKSPAEAVECVYRWNKITEQNARIAYTFNGKQVPASFKLPETKNPTYGFSETTYFQSVIPPSSYGYRSAATRKDRLVAASEWGKMAWITGFDLQKFTGQHRRKLVKLYEDKGWDLPTKWVIVPPAHDALLPRDWVDPDTIIAWDDIKAVKLPAAMNPGSKLDGRIPGSYDCYVDGSFSKGVEANDIDQSKPVYWIEGNRNRASYYVPLLTDQVPAYTLVMMPANRTDKFKRNFPNAENVSIALRTMRDAWLKGLSKDARIALAIHDQHVQGQLSALDASKVDDPNLKRAVKDASYKDLHSALSTRRMFRNVVGDSDEAPYFWTNPLEKYPLFDNGVLRTHPQHTYQYLNLAYAATTKGA
jgi:hypothetical protein